MLAFKNGARCVGCGARATKFCTLSRRIKGRFVIFSSGRAGSQGLSPPASQEHSPRGCRHRMTG